MGGKGRVAVAAEGLGHRPLGQGESAGLFIARTAGPSGGGLVVFAGADGDEALARRRGEVCRGKGESEESGGARGGGFAGGGACRGARWRAPLLA